MAVRAVPEGFHTITPYVFANGGAKLIEFLKAAFQAEVLFNLGAPDGKVMHAQLKIGNSMLMLTDGMQGWPPMPMSCYLYVEDVDAWYQRALAAGAVSLYEPRNEFYGDRACGFKDPTGNVWFIATHIEDVSEEEIERRRNPMKQQ